MDDRKLSQKVVVVEKRDLLSIKGLYKREKLKQLASCHAKLLENGFLKDNVKNISDIQPLQQKVSLHVKWFH